MEFITDPHAEVKMRFQLVKPIEQAQNRVCTRAILDAVTATGDRINRIRVGSIRINLSKHMRNFVFIYEDKTVYNMLPPHVIRPYLKNETSIYEALEGRCNKSEQFHASWWNYIKFNLGMFAKTELFFPNHVPAKLK